MPVADPKSAAPSFRVLILGDHAVHREVVLRQLAALGYEADAVQSGLEALEALSSNAYGLLLTECNMPGMDGYTLARLIRQHEAPGQHLPIIALTANAMDGEITRCLTAGMDDYLSKPVTTATLQGQLRKWMTIDAAAGARAATTPAPQAGR